MEHICYNCFRDSLDENGVCTQCGFDGAKNREKYPLALPLGSILFGRYIIGKVLGQGGFGITYLAQDYQTKGLVAIKEFFPDSMAIRMEKTMVFPLSGERGENFAYGLNSFLEEAKTMAEFIGNPNITRVDSYFEENGTGYFVMEYLEGSSFLDYIKAHGGRLDWEDTMQVVLPIMDALAAMHKKGIIHRDVTPDNIYITKDGTVKLLDFGAARYSLGNVSRSLDVILKHGFAPYEQYSRRGRQGAYTDVYSLGATIYYAITGIKPDDAIERRDEDNLPMPTTLGARITLAQEDALLKAMAVQPTDRYQNMPEFRFAITSARHDCPTEDTTQRNPQTHRHEEQTSSSREKTPRKPVDPVERKKNIKKAVILCAVLALLVSVYPFVQYGIPYIRYSIACRQYASGNYSAAYEAFTALDGYQDSAQKATEALYADACTLMEQEQYDSAIPLFQQLGKYQDSAKKLKQSELYSQYNQAQNLFASGDYLGAYEIYTSLRNFEDSPSKAKEAGYQHAQSCFQKKAYADAYEMFAKLGNYEDSKDKNKEACYQAALQYEQEENYTEAVKFFTKITQYKDVDERLPEVRYQYGLQLESEQKWKEAADQFKLLDTYQDSKDRYSANLYTYAEKLQEKGDLQLATSSYLELGNYKDSKTKAQDAMYAYVLAHKNSSDLSTYNYLKELKKAKYKNSADLYKDLYAYRAVLVAVNTNPNDYSTQKTSVKRSANYLHFEFRLEGGPPSGAGATVTLNARTHWPNGNTDKCNWDWNDKSSGSVFGIEWPDGVYTYPSRGSKGLLTVKVYIKGTKTCIGSGSIKLT